MWRFTIGVIAEWIEEFRLFCMSFWSEIYLLRNDLTVENLSTFLLNKTSQFWIAVKRQSIAVQLILSFLVLSFVVVMIIRLYVRMTKGKCKSEARLDGCTVLVTGANNGIGLETARDLASRGARLVLACRNMAKGIEAARDIMQTTGNENLVVKILDLASLQSVRQFAQDILRTEERLDVLVLNAGLALTKKYMTEDNLELHIATNHLGHFLLTNLLLPLLYRTADLRENPKKQLRSNGSMVATPRGGPVRVVVVSSVAHWWGRIQLDNLNSEKFYDSSRIYGTSKLANLLFANELSRRLKSRGHSNIIVNSLHPGAVQTGLFRNIPYFGKIIKLLIGLLYYSPKEGAQTSIYLSVSEDVKTSGEYYADCRLSACSPEAQDPEVCKQLWIKSSELVQLEFNETFI